METEEIANYIGISRGSAYSDGHKIYPKAAFTWTELDLFGRNTAHAEVRQ